MSSLASSAFFAYELLDKTRILRVSPQVDLPWWLRLMGAGFFLLAGVTDLLFDWTDKGDPVFPYVMFIGTGLVVWATIKAAQD